MRECKMCPNERGLRIVRGLCIRCYERAARAGTVGSFPKTRCGAGFCTVCSKPALCKGLCKYHYENARLAAQPEKLAAATERRAERNAARYAQSSEFRDRQKSLACAPHRRARARAYYLEQRAERPLDFWAWTAASALKGKGCANVSRATLLALLEAQGGCCAICKVHLDRADKRRKPCADHCHTLKVLRGVLCFKCNVMVGNHSSELLSAAAEYVRAHAVT